MSTLGIHGASYLTDISALHTAHSLRELQLEACGKLTTLDDLAGLHALEHLNAADCDDLASATPLHRLTNLHTLDLHGTTKFLDGNLSVLTALPYLKDLRLMDRHHYSPRLPELRADQKPAP